MKPWLVPTCVHFRRPLPDGRGSEPSTEPRPSGSGLPRLLCATLWCCTLALFACVSPQESGVKVIVGAKLDPGAGRPPIDHSVVVVADGKFQAVGPQATTPVPKGADITSGLGMTIEPVPGGGPIDPGQPANLVMKGPTERTMRNGEWAE